MGQGDGQFDIPPDRHLKALRCTAIHRNLQRRGRPAIGCRTAVFDAQGQGDRFADDGKRRRVAHDQAAVPVGPAPAQQQVQRCRQIRGAFDVMYLPVGQRDDPGDAGARFFGQRRRQCRHQFGSGIANAVRYGDAAQFGVGARLDGRAQRLGGLCHLAGAVGQRLAGALVLDQHHDVGERAAVLDLIDRAGQRAQQHQCRQGAQGPAGQAAPQRQHQPGKCQSGDGGKEGRRDQRVKDDGSGHWPSLSSSAGTCT